MTRTFNTKKDKSQRLFKELKKTFPAEVEICYISEEATETALEVRLVKESETKGGEELYAVKKTTEREIQPTTIKKNTLDEKRREWRQQKMTELFDIRCQNDFKESYEQGNIFSGFIRFFSFLYLVGSSLDILEEDDEWMLEICNQPGSVGKKSYDQGNNTSGLIRYQFSNH